MRIFFNGFALSIYLTLLIVQCKFNAVTSDVVSLDSSNLDTILNGNELVLVNFYADWCRFSQMLSPIFDQAEKKISEHYQTPGRVVLAKVDCDRETGVAGMYQVSKYPTLKLFRYGQVMKKEYRGQRSADAFFNFIKDQLENPVSIVQNMDDLEVLDWHKRRIIGYFGSQDSEDYANFKKVAGILREECEFHSASGSMSEKERVAGNKVMYRPNQENYNEIMYPGPLGDYNMFLKWVTDKCIPLVREITFENAEELTEEGLPFLILFHGPDDHETPEKFKKQVVLQLLPDRNFINFLVADGLKFTHPLHHLGKSASDLPVLAIDSFKHMYVWRHDVKENLEKSGMLRQFVNDLKSGKLHREFHDGPDPTSSPAQQKIEEVTEGEAPSSPGHLPHDSTQSSTQKEVHGQTSPPESLFKKLAPSRTRYTILKDEL